MQFDQLLTEKEAEDPKAAEKAASELDVTPEAIRLWRKGKRLPRREKMAQIEEWSGGKVTPGDWYSSSAGEAA